MCGIHSRGGKDSATASASASASSAAAAVALQESIIAGPDACRTPTELAIHLLHQHHVQQHLPDTWQGAEYWVQVGPHWPDGAATPPNPQAANLHTTAVTAFFDELACTIVALFYCAAAEGDIAALEEGIASLPCQAPLPSGRAYDEEQRADAETSS